MKYLKIFGMLFAFMCIFTLSACNAQPNTSVPSDSVEETPNDNDNDMNGGTMKLEINGEVFHVVLEVNETSKAFYNLLPQEFTMRELNNNEKYYYLNTSLPTDDECPGTINAGDIMLWGDNCIVIFYKTFKTPYSYTKIGEISNTENLESCLGADSVVVKFDK